MPNKFIHWNEPTCAFCQSIFKFLVTSTRLKNKSLHGTSASHLHLKNSTSILKCSLFCAYQMYCGFSLVLCWYWIELFILFIFLFSFQMHNTVQYISVGSCRITGALLRAECSLEQVQHKTDFNGQPPWPDKELPETSLYSGECQASLLREHAQVRSCGIQMSSYLFPLCPSSCFGCPLCQRWDSSLHSLLPH